jgi:hypothetical protein
MAETPELIQHWLDNTSLLMLVAEAWAAGDPDQQSADALANLTRIQIRNTALASVLASARAMRIIPPPPEAPDTDA